MKKRLKTTLNCLIFLTLIGYSLVGFSKTSLTHFHLSTVNHHPHLIFSLDQSPTYRVFTLHHPDRLVIDFDQTSLKTNIATNLKRNLFIKDIRTGKHGEQGLRIVIDLKQSMKPNFFILKQKTHTRDLILDLLPSKIHPVKAAPNPLKPITFKKKPLRNAVVVIDPGHGGKDPGAIGLMGTKEKNVVLAIGKDLYALLKKQHGIEPRLTRHGDYFVPLRGRLKLARKGVADLFVAIHADAYRNHYARGASVFALSQHGASTEAARWLAQKENYSELMGGVDLKDKSYMLRSVLIDLSQTATIRDSLKLGSLEIHSLKHIARLHHGSVEQAPFMVLKSPDIPSILVETGFLSNRYEEAQLRTSSYQHKIAHALMTGIVEYLHRYPPKGTYLTTTNKKH